MNHIHMNMRGASPGSLGGSLLRPLLLATSVAWLGAACGAGHAPPPDRDAAAVDGGRVEGSDAAIADAGPFDAGGPGACSAENPERCAYVPAETYGELPLLTREVTYTDVLGEARTVEITLARPDGAPTPWPLVVWSHGGMTGMMSSVGVGDEWRGVFTGAGYAFLGIAHRPRSDESRGRLCEHFGITVVADCARAKYLHYDRPHDFAAVLDYVEEQSTGMLAGVVDLERVLYAGHSAGSGGASLVAGATRTIFDVPQMGSDPRPLAFIGASMEGVGDDGFGEDAFDAMARPHLTLSGVGDVTPEATAPPRRLPFERMMPGDKYRLWITDATARHTTFNHSRTDCAEFAATRGLDASACDAHLVWLESAVLAFTDAHLRDRPEARAWLASDAIVIMSAGVVEWSRR